MKEEGSAATFSYRFESMRTSADAFVTFADRLGRDGFGFLMPTTMGHLYFKPSSCTGENCAVMYSLTQS